MRDIADIIMGKVDVASYSTRLLIGLPLTVLMLALIIIGATYADCGAPVQMGVDFKGGTIITLNTSEGTAALAEKFSSYPDVSIREGGGRMMVHLGPMNEKLMDTLVESVNHDYPGSEIRTMGEVFGHELQWQAVQAVAYAFIGMVIVIFIIFRTMVPSFSVVFSAMSDMIIAVAIMDAVGMQMSLATVAALLMIIGYSVDSNILLSTRMLRTGKGRVEDKIRGAMRTGLMMSTTTMSAILVMLVVSNSFYLIPPYTSIPVLRDISLVLLFGMCADMMNTWLLNAGIMRMYLEYLERMKKKRSKKKRTKSTRSKGDKSGKRGGGRR